MLKGLKVSLLYNLSKVLKYFQLIIILISINKIYYLYSYKKVLRYVKSNIINCKERVRSLIKYLIITFTFSLCFS